MCYGFLLLIGNLILVLMTILKMEPWLILLWTDTLPPICSIILLQMLNPSPVPCKFIWECSSNFPNSMNKFFKFYSEMPTPWSFISILIFAYFSQSMWSSPWIRIFLLIFFFIWWERSWNSRIDKQTVIYFPLSVNLIEFDKKLRSICINLP